MQRHEIPTHLDVADRAFAGLTMRQLLSAAIGLTLVYGAAGDLPGPLALRLLVAAMVLVGTLLLVLWRPVGRPAEEWAFVLLRFWTSARIAVWRPGGPSTPRSGRREIVLPAPAEQAMAARAHRRVPEKGAARGALS